MRRPVLAASVALLVAAVVLGSALVLVHRTHDGSTRVVRTDHGSVRGSVAAGEQRWRGIPYAAAPVGPLRWQPPHPAVAWSGVRDATQPAAPCLQPAPYVFGAAALVPQAGSSEDCLSLDVARPDDDRTELPVVVWLHGGGFFGGSTGGVYDGPGLVEQGAVVVTVGYRLGRLGFFAHPSLGGDVADFGLLDQIAALRWVRANIASFGGDPHLVTLAGDSAGAMSVNALMCAPPARGLFERAIAQSAPGDSADLTLVAARAAGERAFPGLTSTQLRALPSKDLLSSTFNTLRGDAPLLDAVLPTSADACFAAGREAPVPYLVGTSDGEFADADLASFHAHPAALRARLARRHPAVRATYGGAFDAHVLDDLVFTAPALAKASSHARLAPTYRYRFSGLGPESRHESELRFLFGTVTDPKQIALGDQMTGYWIDFARSGDPEVCGAPTWPRAHGSAYVQIDPTGARPVDHDPWAPRLTALGRAVPLVLPDP